MHKKYRDHWLWWWNSPLCQCLQTSVFAVVLCSIKADLDASDQPNCLWEKQVLIFPFHGISYNLVPRSGAAEVANEVVVCFNTVLTGSLSWKTVSIPKSLPFRLFVPLMTTLPLLPSLPCPPGDGLHWTKESSQHLFCNLNQWHKLCYNSSVWSLYEILWKDFFLWGTIMVVSNRGSKVFHHHEHVKQLYSFCICS